VNASDADPVGGGADDSRAVGRASRDASSTSATSARVDALDGIVAAGATGDGAVDPCAVRGGSIQPVTTAATGIDTLDTASRINRHGNRRRRRRGVRVAELHFRDPVSGQSIRRFGTGHDACAHPRCRHPEQHLATPYSGSWMVGRLVIVILRPVGVSTVVGHFGHLSCPPTHREGEYDLDPRGCIVK
jgi:hypothetical protein